MSNPFNFFLGQPEPPTPSDFDYEQDDPHGILESLRRKRERDRHSQRRKRQRERDYINGLENEVRILKERLKKNECNCDNLLDARRASGQGSASDAGTPARMTDSDASPLREVTPYAALGTMKIESYDTINAAATLFSPIDATMVNAPWLRVPEYCGFSTPNQRLLTYANRCTKFVACLRLDTDAASRCPLVPKTIDLLFGGSSNILANFVASEVQAFPLLAPEKFAYSWVVYLYLLWIIWPTEERFNALPEHLRPTETQLLQSHVICYDFILWPEIRDNLIRHGAKYDLTEVFGLLACTGRIRGGFNRPFITRENDGDPQVRNDFYQDFLKKSSWGLLEKFWIDYPELVEGMDRSQMITEEDLLLM